MIEEYKRLLRIHDWQYDYADDHSVWTRGKNEREKLVRLANDLDPDFSIWNSIAPEEFHRKRRLS